MYSILDFIFRVVVKVGDGGVELRVRFESNYVWGLRTPLQITNPVLHILYLYKVLTALSLSSTLTADCLVIKLTL